MNPVSLFKKASYFKLMINNPLKQSTIEELVSKYPFKRCKENQLLSMGFKHPLDSTSEEAYSYAVGDWIILTIQIEEKSISSSEVNYEVHEIVTDIQKREVRKVTKEEKDEIKEKVFAEKAKTAPSVFSSVNIAVDNYGNLILNTTSGKIIDRANELLLRVLQEYTTDIIDGFSNDFPMASTKILRENGGGFPSDLFLSIGEKGEGKNGGKKISFSKIVSDDENILSMLKGYDLEITKLEIYYTYKDYPLIAFVSSKGIESFKLSDELSDYISEQSEDAGTPEEEFDVEFNVYLDIIREFHKEYFAFLKKIIPFSKADYNVVEKRFGDAKEFLDFVSNK